MDPRLLKYYNRELQYMREMGGEFAKEFPKIAGRLGLEEFECADPYVERLLEGFSFLAARIQLKLDAEFPRFTQHLLESVYPHYLAPTPSMAVVQFRPDLTEGTLAAGVAVPRGSALRTAISSGEQTACEYRTAHDLDLWPLDLAEAEYYANSREVADLGVPGHEDAKAAIRLRLRSIAGLTFDKLSLQSLPIFLQGGEGDPVPMHVYEHLFSDAVKVVARPPGRPVAWQEVIDKSHLHRMGFDDEQALLPYGPRSFSGYRLLQEYFAFHHRYMFIELGGLGPAVRRCGGSELDIIFLLRRSDPILENNVGVSNFALFCTPAINLFPKRADRIHLSEKTTEHQVIPDRTRPIDFEVYQVGKVVGYGTSAEIEQEFLPLYSTSEATMRDGKMAYYAIRRLPRVLSTRQRGTRHRMPTIRSSYIGSEVFVSLVDANEAPYSTELRQLSLETLCTNRDLPLLMPVGQGKTDFSLETGAPVEEVRCVKGPTEPRPSHPEGEIAWRLVSHLSLNYLSLTDTDEKQRAEAMREILTLYGGTGDPHLRAQVDGLRSVRAKPVTRRIPTPGPITFGRGQEVTVTFDESAFEGSGMFLLGAVLEQFFARYASINSFTETVVRTLDRGEIKRWPLRSGQRHTL